LIYYIRGNLVQFCVMLCL